MTFAQRQWDVKGKAKNNCPLHLTKNENNTDMKKSIFLKSCVCYLFLVQRLLLSRSPYLYSFAKIPRLKLGNKRIHSIQSNTIKMFDISRTMRRSIISLFMEIYTAWWTICCFGMILQKSQSLFICRHKVYRLLRLN